MRHAGPWLMLSMLLAGCAPGSAPDTSAVVIDQDDIAGTVTGPAGPEAGVWVIAETNAFDTRFARIVVTDDAGRFLIPDLPRAGYQVWVRGYGLRDSARVTAAPGQRVALTAEPARDPREAAQSYPAAYWYAMMRLPDEDQVSFLEGGRRQYLMWMKNMGCVGCHQMGQLATRTIPLTHRAAGASQAAWQQRIQAGQAGDAMVRIANGVLRGVPIRYLADWTDRIAAGEVPDGAPPRPSGLARNVVATVRDWSTPRAYLHDLSGTDRRNPVINAYGPLYGAPELSTDDMPILDPVHNTAGRFTLPVRDADTPTTADMPVVGRSHYWADTPIWDSRANVHNPMLDADGRVWLTARIRGVGNPDFCRPGSTHASAQRFPTTRSGRQLAVFDPRDRSYRFVDTCFGTPPAA